MVSRWRRTPDRNTLRRACWNVLPGFAVAIGLGGASTAFGQARGGPVRANQARPAAQADGGSGLDSLKDDAVVAKLTAYGQDSLASKLAGSMGYSKDQVAGLKVLKALEELNATPLEKLTNNKRQDLMKQVVAGLDAVLPSLKDANTLMTYTAALITKGVEPDVNTLEYWGDNPNAQAELKPGVQSVIKLLDKVATEAEEEKKKIEATLKGANDPAGDRWLKLDQTESTSKYVENLVAYYLALATDPSKPEGQKERKEIADKAITYLKDYDTEDSNVMPLVHTRIGKLYMVEGNYDKARKYFGDIAKKDPTIKPEPNLGQVFEAKFFGVLTDLLDKKTDDAAKGLADLEGWVKGNIPADQQAAVEAAVMLARYRVADQQATLAKDPGQKKQFDDQASALLTQLYDKFPQFRGLITEQLVTRLGDNPDLTKANVPVLWAVVAKGNVERAKAEGQPVDKKVLERAMAAARELSTRKEGVDAKKQEEASLLVPLFEEKLGDNVAAANAYVDFANRFKKTNPSLSGETADRAVFLAIQAKKADANNPAVKDAYGKALATAVGEPFRRKPLYYFYAQWLYSQNKPQEALPFFQAVPKGDPNEFSARFTSLLALNNQLEDSKITPAARQKVMAELDPLVDQVRSLGQAHLATTKTPDQVKARIAYATMLGADLAIREKQPQRALQLLQGFEDQIKGNPAEAALSQAASRVRVNAFLATNQIDKAQDEVQKLASSDPQGSAALVQQVLKRLEDDYDAAEKAGNEKETASILGARASLTGVLYKWASSNSDPKIKGLSLDYQIYDANTKRLAGAHQKDDAEKKKLLDEALAQYTSAKDKLNAEAKQTGKPASVQTETNLNFNMGLCAYDLGNYAAARDSLGVLIALGRLGGPQTEVTEGGETRLKDNDYYWEAMYKWLKSRQNLYKANPSDPTLSKDFDAAKDTLRRLFITNAARTGGQKYADEFDALRKELIPDWVPGSVAAPSTTQPSTQPAAPATQPVAAGVGR